MSILKSGWFSIINDTENSQSIINKITPSTNEKEKENENENENMFIFEIDSDKINKKIEILEKRTEKCENIYNSILETLNDLKKSIEEMENKDRELKEEIEKIGVRLKTNETTCNVIRNENLKLINRILEAEISVERTTNILLRKHISFPFTPLSNKFNL
jgi:chromosome segregation ATPase